MNIVVNVKIVPEKISVDKESCRIKREGDSIFNPLDLIALEEAIKFKKMGNTFISVVSMAPLKEKTLLSKLFKYGVDRVILLTDKSFAGSDTIATSFVLKEAIIRLIKTYDLIIQGDFSLDGSTGNVGGEIAAFLNIPYVSNAISIEKNGGGRIKVKRVSERIEIFSVELPALISVRKEANNGVSTNLFSLVQSFNKEVEVYTNETLNLGLRESMTRVLNVREENPEAYTDLVTSNGEKIIFDFLKKVGII
jgi:electron transfer flavoprotein beta subunit